MKSEVWLPVPGYEGRYSVSDFGNVMSMNYRRTDMLKIMQPSNDKYGYPRLILHKEGKKYWTVHSLILLAFVGPKLKGMQVNHKNGIKTDNRLSNLEYCTDLQNKQHAKTMGLYPNGEKHHNAKLTDNAVIEIKRKLAAGMTQISIAREHGVSKSLISSIVCGLNWKHVIIETLQ